MVGASLAEHGGAPLEADWEKAVVNAGLISPVMSSSGIASAIVNPVVGRAGRSEDGARATYARENVVFAVIGAHVAVDVQEAHQMSALIDSQGAPTCAPKLIGLVVCGEAGELTPQGLDLGRPVEAQQPAEGGRIALFQMLWTPGCAAAPSASSVSNVVRRP